MTSDVADDNSRLPCRKSQASSRSLSLAKFYGFYSGNSGRAGYLEGGYRDGNSGLVDITKGTTNLNKLNRNQIYS